MNKLLVVDDEQSFRGPLCETLGDDGFLVTSACSGIEALEVMENDPPDIVITDIQMPDMDGLELMSNIRKLYPDIMILIMTAYGTLETARTAIKRGAYDYIMKPFNIVEIKKAINHAIDRNNLARENTRLKETLSLFEVSKALRNTTSSDDLLQLILTSALNQAGATRGSLMVRDEKSKELVIRASAGIENEIVRKTRVKIGEGIAGQVAEKGKPTLVSDVSRHSLFKKHSHQFPDKSFISVPLNLPKEEELLSIPLKTKKKVIGILNLNRPKTGKTFTEADLRLTSILAGQAAITIENANLFQNIEESYLSIMKSLSLILDGKSPFTRGHSERVTKYAIAIAKEMKLTSAEIKIIADGAILHDIGKIGVSDIILNKPDKLTPAEYETIKQHPVIGHNMLKPIQFLQKSLPIVKHHHERMDGKGYPDGISGENLTYPVRICIVADAYDAMTSDRPYRKTLPGKVIFNELEEKSGSQFDKEVVAALLKMEKSENKRTQG